MRKGVRLGIDVGMKRIGVARSDSEGLLATPVCTVMRETLEQSAAEVVAIVKEFKAFECVIGLPLSMSGNNSQSTDDARDFAAAVKELLRGEMATVDIRMLDERLTTVSAHAALRTSGKKPSRARDTVDQVAAVILLQQALDQERATGRPPGFAI